MWILSEANIKIIVSGKSNWHKIKNTICLEFTQNINLIHLATIIYHKVYYINISISDTLSKMIKLEKGSLQYLTNK